MKRTIALMLALALCLGLCACGSSSPSAAVSPSEEPAAVQTPEPTPEPTPTATPEPAPEPTPEPTPEPPSVFVDQGLDVRVICLSDAEGVEMKYHNTRTPGKEEYDETVIFSWGNVSRSMGYDLTGMEVYFPDEAHPETIESYAFMDLVNAILENDEEDYELRILSLRVKYDGKFGFVKTLADYYNTELWESSAKQVKISPNSFYNTHTVIFNGEERSVYEAHSIYDMDEDTVYVVAICYVPKGYDGVVFALLGAATGLRNEYAYLKGKHFYDYVDDDTILIRLS